VHFHLKPEGAARIAWHIRGTCGEPGCTDRYCRCSICDLPIGAAEDDPRWRDHDEYCGDCEVCRDQVPVMLFRGEGKLMEQARFHNACFQELAEFAE
jgi:hypothetical protein